MPEKRLTRGQRELAEGISAVNKNVDPQEAAKGLSDFIKQQRRKGKVVGGARNVNVNDNGQGTMEVSLHERISRKHGIIERKIGKALQRGENPIFIEQSEDGKTATGTVLDISAMRKRNQ